jgi:hypothetical protein
MSDAEIARAILTMMYSRVASLTDRNIKMQSFRLFSHSLPQRRILRSVPSPTASGRVYESPKTSCMVTIYVGLSGDPETCHTLQLGQKWSTSSRIYNLVRKQAWCPQHPFILLRGTRLLDKCGLDFKDALFRDGEVRLSLLPDPGLELTDSVL